MKTSAICPLTCGRTETVDSGSTLPTRAAFEASFEVIREHESELVVQLLAGLVRIPGVDVYGITEPDRVVDRTPPR